MTLDGGIYRDAPIPTEVPPLSTPSPTTLWSLFYTIYTHHLLHYFLRGQNLIWLNFPNEAN